MTNQEYEKAKAECWEEFKEKHFNGNAPWSPYSAFDFTFDRAYALGKQEKDADEQDVLTCEKRKVLYRFRMAEACKIGNNPETDYWIGYSKAIQDLFGLEGEPYVTPNEADTVINGWVAIDEAYGECFLHTEKPIQKAQPIADTGDYITVWDSKGKTYLLDAGLFPDMDSDSDPIEVELIIKRKKK